MISDYIDQVQRAHLYMAEPQRIRRLGGVSFEFQGLKHTRLVHRNGSGWECSCTDFKRTQGVGYPCSHIIALHRVLNDQPELTHS